MPPVGCGQQEPASVELASARSPVAVGFACPFGDRETDTGSGIPGSIPSTHPTVRMGGLGIAAAKVGSAHRFVQCSTERQDLRAQKMPNVALA